MATFEEEIFSFLSGLCGRVERVAVPEGDVLRAVRIMVCCRGGASVLGVVTVPLLFFVGGGRVEELTALEDGLREDGVPDVLLLYEDRWKGLGPLVRSMLEVRLGAGPRVFARNCEVRTVSAETAAEFLGRNHLYGAAKAPYRLGLYRMRSTGAGEAPMDGTPGLVAVATFSAGRMMRDGVMSYEWVRYASARGVRVSGGMGRLLWAFVAGRRAGGCQDGTGAMEVMSYCDLEWYDGRSYLQMGFADEGVRPPVAFLCPPDGSCRIHEGKLKTDRRFRQLAGEAAVVENMVRIFNPGSRRLVYRFGAV